MEKQSKEIITFYDLFIPLTNKKAIVFIILIGFIVYFNSLFNNFVWDDLLYLINNPQVHSIQLLSGFKENFFNRLGQYRPLPEIYFSILYSLFKTTPFFYHIIQLTLHIINTVLVFFLFQKYFKKSLSFFLSLIFLIHPLQVESVSFISSSDNPLFFLFGISALLLVNNKKVNVKKTIVIFSLLLLSLLTKETGFGFLLLTLLIEYLFYRKNIIQFTIAGILTFAIYCIIRFWFGGVSLDGTQSAWIIPMLNLSLIQRLSNTPEVLFYYLNNFVFPQKLAIDQQWTIPSIDFTHFYLPLILDFSVFVGILILGFYQYYKTKNIKVWMLFSLWFIGGLAIYSQLAPLDSTVADRWFYFPMVGLLGLIGILLSDFPIKNSKIAVSIAVVIICLFSIRTIIRNTNWSNNITLYTHDSAISTNFDLENDLGIYLLSSGQCNLALVHFTKSVNMNMTDFSLGNLGLADACLKRYKKASIDYTHAMAARGYLVTKPHKHTLPLYINAINFFVFNGYPSLGKKYIYMALNDYPNTAVLYHYLAAYQFTQGFKQQAEKTEKKADSLPKNSQYMDVYLLVKNNILSY